MKITIVSFCIYAFILLLATYFLLPFILTRESIFGIDYSNTGQIGDTFGGILGPVFSYLAAITAFLAFYVQYRANREQTAQFKRQAIDTQYQRFESNFFELIRIHRENTVSVTADGEKGRESFRPIFHELNHVMAVMTRFTELKDIKISTSELVEVSFTIVYVGAKSSNRPDLLDALSGYDKEFVETIVGLSSVLLYEDERQKRPDYYDIEKYSYVSELSLYGYSFELGPYFRHLWATVDFVDKLPGDIFPKTVKMDYVNMLRAQLSDYEQLVFHYFALTSMGAHWHDSGLLSEYKMTNTMPKAMCHFGPKLEEIYEDSNYFKKSNI